MIDYSWINNDFTLLEKNFCFLRRISSFLGVCSYLLVFPFPTFPFTQEWECKEKNSINISGVEFVKKEKKQKEKIKTYPKKFLEEKVKDLKTFEVFYDKKVGGIIIGSPFLIMMGNLEEKGEANSNVTTTTDAYNDEIFEEKSIFTEKNTSVPITFYSISKDLEETVEQKNNFFNKNLESISSLITFKKFFTIENIWSDTPEFSLLKISNNDVFNSIIDSNDNETYTGDLSELIELSQGECVVKSRKIN